MVAGWGFVWYDVAIKRGGGRHEAKNAGFGYRGTNAPRAVGGAQRDGLRAPGAMEQALLRHACVEAHLSHAALAGSLVCESARPGLPGAAVPYARPERSGYAAAGQPFQGNAYGLSDAGGGTDDGVPGGIGRRGAGGTPAGLRVYAHDAYPGAAPAPEHAHGHADGLYHSRNGPLAARAGAGKANAARNIRSVLLRKRINLYPRWRLLHPKFEAGRTARQAHRQVWTYAAAVFERIPPRSV